MKKAILIGLVCVVLLSVGSVTGTQQEVQECCPSYEVRIDGVPREVERGDLFYLGIEFSNYGNLSVGRMEFNFTLSDGLYWTIQPTEQVLQFWEDIPHYSPIMLRSFEVRTATMGFHTILLQFTPEQGKVNMVELGIWVVPFLSSGFWHSVQVNMRWVLVGGIFGVVLGLIIALAIWLKSKD